jgi:hypothetical protein
VPLPIYFFYAAFNFFHRARCAAASTLLSAGRRWIFLPARSRSGYPLGTQCRALRP